MSTRSRANPGGMDVLEVLGPDVRPFRERKPPWLKVPAPGGTRYRELKERIENEGLHTVCQEAACPNIGECWERGTATFMILGDTCTRRCGFCNVKTGKPTFHDPLEPARVARQVATMGLRHAVITSVDRDDLPDYGASAFVGVIRQIRHQAPACKVEVLTPDFRGAEMPLAKVIAERPDVFNHNVEVVPRLYPVARRGSEFLRSCRVLRNAKDMGGDEVVTKSGLMVGLGETHDELVDAFGVLREHGVQVLTVGQYLRPTERHLPVVRYWHPDEFAALERAALDLGFENVAAGPLVPLELPRGRARPAGAPGRRAARRRDVRLAGRSPRRYAPLRSSSCPPCAGAATARAVANQNRFGFPPTVDLSYDASPGEANRLTITAPPGTTRRDRAARPRRRCRPGGRVRAHRRPRRHVLAPPADRAHRPGAGRLRPHHRGSSGMARTRRAWRAACPPSCAGRAATTCCEGPRART